MKKEVSEELRPASGPIQVRFVINGTASTRAAIAMLSNQLNSTASTSWGDI